MIEWIKGRILLLNTYRKHKKEYSNMYKAHKHALLALGYWNLCKEDHDIHLQIENSTTYIRMGK